MSAPLPSDWVVCLALPNLSVNYTIENEHVALVSSKDQRVLQLRDKHQNLDQYLDRFTDAFGRTIEPGVVISTQSALSEIPAPNANAFLGFRDLVAVSVTCKNTAQTLNGSSMSSSRWSNTFWIYPWLLDKDYDSLTMSSVSVLGQHSVDDFAGQSTPGIALSRIEKWDVDGPLLTHLLQRWSKMFLGKRKSSRDVALFRSLNMAYQASLAPSESYFREYDVGRIIALWISAFEIIAHPRNKKSNVNSGSVFKLLETDHWQNKRLIDKKYIVGRSRTRKRNLLIKICSELYRARHDYLHGNHLTEASLRIHRKGTNLLDCAAPIYRLLLTSFLDIRYDHHTDYIGFPDELDRAFRGVLFREMQKEHEDALLSAYK